MSIKPLPYNNALDTYENSNTPYTLKVYIPPRGNTHRITSIFKRSPSPEKTHITLRDVVDTDYITLKASAFPLQHRCVHAYRTGRGCEYACYVLENGGEAGFGKCKAKGCEGHRWAGDGVDMLGTEWCFGRPGQRVVMIGRVRPVYGDEGFRGLEDRVGK
ncbi:hypothetical protein M011DRAFT_307106 [Sporormia fimetaria CBS 119925]|uniref:Uncharacterized protein n=1 Tax=Sporormia fimetaria CBS 119925 TaxID=1340428 RepID=A0A6A6VHY5_9PLEO|nr:hypothetical protein M011DRAFT_307106 [Sporormia fimetaria CBS 119925]